MGNACLGQPRKNVHLMKKQTPGRRYQSQPQRDKKIKKAVVGESEGNRIKVKVNLITCSVCMNSYNTTNRQPHLVCANSHTYCKECTSQFRRTNGKCPECRAEMRNPTIRNRDIFQLIEDNQKIIEEDKLQEVQVLQTDQVKVKVDLKNPRIFNYWVQDERVMKIQNNKIWQGFFCQEVLPNNRESFFTVRILATQFANIKIGIVGTGYKCEKNVTCPEAVVYHLADGKILQGGRGIYGSEWRGQGNRIQMSPGITTLITCRVNPRLQLVSWFEEQKFLGQGRFSQHLKSNPFVAYVMLCHKGDTIELNA